MTLLHHGSKKHACSLNLGSDSMLPKKDGVKARCRFIRKLTLITQYHPETELEFKSYPAVIAERQRQVVEGGSWIVHPYSLLSLIWTCFMTFINVAFLIIAPLRFSYVLPKTPAEYVVIDHILLALQCFVFLDIILQFNTGYRDNRDTYIVMTRSRIVCRYLISWFAVDLVSVVPLGHTVPWLHYRYRYQMLIHLLPCIRFTRITTVLKDFHNLVQVLKISYMARRGLRHALLFIISMHWSSCIMYVVPIIHFYWSGVKPEGFCKFLVKQNGDITLISAWYRYEKALFVSCAAFFGTGYTMFDSQVSEEIAVYSLIILYGSVFMVYTIVLLLKAYMTLFNSSLRYHELMNQVEKYMRHRQFPVQMRNRIRDFYRYRYQERYFKEEAALDCLSEQLRNEITLDTCRKLIDKVSLFEGLPPSVVGTVLGCLKPEVYMPNDLVVSAGDEGNCMYFIATGTVAVYSLKGAEVCHLEDGAHFGEVALLMKDSKRIATVVAIEITHVYRLDAPDFRNFLKTYQDLYERVEILASKRMHETVLIDEAFKHGSSL